MRYLSLFSGIEAASVAWLPLGWEPLAFSEIDPFPCAVLAHHYPDVPNLGDICNIDWQEFLNEHGRPDIIVGGSPCQSFSIAGKREGRAGASGLMAEYIRAVREVRPRVFVWENVPGALTVERGAAFGQLLSEMDGIGYRCAWRILDSEFFGVPQRRRRVFLVGCLGDIDPAEILFEQEGLRRDFASSNKKRQELTRAAGRGVEGSGSECLTMRKVEAVATAIRTANSGANGSGIMEECAHTIDTTQSEAIAFAQNTRDEVRLLGGDGSYAGALAASNGAKQQTYICVSDAVTISDNSRWVVRRLTPIECERLQGFPDGYTDIGEWIDASGRKRKSADTNRYKALGNSFTVNVVRWIGQRIALVASD